MISIITPAIKEHELYMRETYESLVGQTLSSWEWVILLNKGAIVSEDISKDSRVKVFTAKDDLDVSHNRIGRLKSEACQLASGDIIVELDDDDILLPDALNKINQVFEKESAVFVYSNSAEFKDKTWESNYYKEYWGWKHRIFNYEGHDLYEMVAWPPSPHMMRYIFWAPNHARAWRAKAYWDVGGHDKTLLNGDDHDLCCKFYLKYGAAGFRHIDECLYLYRVHDSNSCRVYNQEIQEQTDVNYRKYSRDLVTRWANDNGLALVDLGGRYNAWPGYKTVDRHEPADIIHNLNEGFPFEDNSVGVLKAYHVFEHLRDPVHSMNEAYRVLAPGGWFFIEVPSTDGRGAAQDPTHVSFWNENSFWYYTQKNYAAFIKPEMQCRFQKSRIVTYFPDDFFKKNDIPIVQADLIALKPPYDKRPVGEVLI